MSPRTLAPCPSSPNCVSTQAQDEGHAIVPIRYRKSRVEAKEALKGVIRSLPRTKLVVVDESYLHYEFTSLLLRFVDEVVGRLEGVTRTRTVVVPWKLKDVYEWHIPDSVE
jgi:uncharacterized protein (DUF1499 family)